VRVRVYDITLSGWSRKRCHYFHKIWLSVQRKSYDVRKQRKDINCIILAQYEHFRVLKQEICKKYKLQQIIYNNVTEGHNFSHNIS